VPELDPLAFGMACTSRIRREADLPARWGQGFGTVNRAPLAPDNDRLLDIGADGVDIEDQHAHSVEIGKGSGVRRGLGSRSMPSSGVSNGATPWRWFRAGPGSWPTVWGQPRSGLNRTDRLALLPDRRRPNADTTLAGRLRWRTLNGPNLAGHPMGGTPPKGRVTGRRHRRGRRAWGPVGPLITRSHRNGIMNTWAVLEGPTYSVPAI